MMFKWLYDLAAGLYLFVCGALFCVFVAGVVRRSRSLRMASGVALLLLVGIGGCVEFGDALIPLSTRAARLVTLPSEATVVRVQEGDWAGDGEVFFQLPASRSERDWMADVWARNTDGRRGATEQPTARHWTFKGADNSSRELEYDPDTRLWRFSVMLDL